jgi:hypothetical protein
MSKSKVPHFQITAGWLTGQDGLPLMVHARSAGLSILGRDEPIRNWWGGRISHACTGP